jgi:putative membrane protein
MLCLTPDPEALMAAEPPSTVELLFQDPSVEMSSNRTAMSFERTHMSADRTLMSVIRTALSLISFGFTIYQFFHSVSPALGATARVHGARVFALSLILIGVFLLAAGIANHVATAFALRRRRVRLQSAGLVRTVQPMRPAAVTLVALLLLVLGLVAIASVGFRYGPLR